MIQMRFGLAAARERRARRAQRRRARVRMGAEGNMFYTAKYGQVFDDSRAPNGKLRAARRLSTPRSLGSSEPRPTEPLRTRWRDCGAPRGERTRPRMPLVPALPV